MTLTPHAIVGAAIANLMPQNPELGFALAFASHYALDMIPHRDYDIDGFFDENTKTFTSILQSARSAFNALLIVFDFLIGILICLLIFVRNRETFFITLLGIAGGVFPDFLQFLYFIFKKKPWTFFQDIHDFFHSKNKMKDKPIEGSFVQLFAAAFFVVIYFVLR